MEKRPDQRLRRRGKPRQSRIRRGEWGRAMRREYEPQSKISASISRQGMKPAASRQEETEARRSMGSPLPSRAAKQLEEI